MFFRYRHLLECAAKVLQTTRQPIERKATQDFWEIYNNCPYLCAFRECPRAYDGFESTQERDDHEDDHVNWDNPSSRKFTFTSPRPKYSGDISGTGSVKNPSECKPLRRRAREEDLRRRRQEKADTESLLCDALIRALEPRSILLSDTLSPTIMASGSFNTRSVGLFQTSAIDSLNATVDVSSAQNASITLRPTPTQDKE